MAALGIVADVQPAWLWLLILVPIVVLYPAWRARRLGGRGAVADGHKVCPPRRSEETAVAKEASAVALGRDWPAGRFERLIVLCGNPSEAGDVEVAPKASRDP